MAKDEISIKVLEQQSVAFLLDPTMKVDTKRILMCANNPGTCEYRRRVFRRYVCNGVTVNFFVGERYADQGHPWCWRKWRK